MQSLTLSGLQRIAVLEAKSRMSSLVTLRRISVDNRGLTLKSKEQGLLHVWCQQIDFEGFAEKTLVLETICTVRTLTDGHLEIQ